MKSLLLYKTELPKKLEEALKEYFETVDKLNLKEIHLIIKNNHPYIKPGNLNINNYDFVYPLLNPSLESFAEPLFEELQERKIITPFLPSSFYSLNNEALIYSNLKTQNLEIPKLIFTQNPSNLKKESLNFKFPCLLKVFHQQKKIQTSIFDTRKSLLSYLDGLRLEPDCLLLREFDENDVIYCLTIGENLFTLKRKWNGTQLEKYLSYSPTIEEKTLALKATKTLGLELAQIKICNNKIIGIELPNLSLFQEKTGQDIFSFFSKYFHTKAKETQELRKDNNLIGSLTKGLKGVFK